MELDKRIEKLTDVLTCINVEEAKQFIGQTGYFTDTIDLFDNLEARKYAVLATVDDCDAPFRPQGGTCYWRYFIPECRLKPKEKKYRPYTIEEFNDEGFEFVVFREKNNPSNENHVRYNGYRNRLGIIVILGNISYSLDDLFADFELLDDDGNWKPFGVEEEC